MEMKNILNRPMCKALLLLFMTALNFTSADAQLKPPSDAELRKRLESDTGKQKKAPGIVVGVIDERGSRVIASGVMKKGETNSVDSNALFEIGSVTKTFTALLLQDMVDRGEVKLDE